MSCLVLAFDPAKKHDDLTGEDRNELAENIDYMEIFCLLRNLMIIRLI